MRMLTGVCTKALIPAVTHSFVHPGSHLFRRRSLEASRRILGLPRVRAVMEYGVLGLLGATLSVSMQQR